MNWLDLMSKYHEYYDKLNYGKKDYANEVSRLHKLYDDLVPGWEDRPDRFQKILEIGSGTGSHTKHLCSISREVHAVDTDLEMIEVASKKLKGHCVKFYQDISKVPLRDFPMCVMMWHVLNYFPSIQVMEHIFSNTYDRLEKGGLFVFDAWNGVAVIRDLPKTTKNEINVNGQRIVHELNGSTSLMDQRTLILNKIEVYEGLKLIDSFSQEVVHHIWTPKVVANLLTKTGFEVVRIAKVNDYSKIANEDDWKILFVAKKHET